MTQKSVANIDLDPVVRAMVDAGLNELVRQGVAYVVSAAVAQHHDETQIEIPHFEFGSDTPTGYVKVSPMSAVHGDEVKPYPFKTGVDQQQHEHVLYTDEDADRPDVICDSNGQVVLSLCKNCGRGECELDEHPVCDQRRVKDAHTEHCCSKHGCKYGQEDCTVATGQKEQSHPCEYCAEEVKADRDTLLDEVREVLVSFGYGEKNGFDNPVSAVHAMGDKILDLEQKSLIATGRVCVDAQSLCDLLQYAFSRRTNIHKADCFRTLEKTLQSYINEGGELK